MIGCAATDAPLTTLGCVATAAITPNARKDTLMTADPQARDGEQTGQGAVQAATPAAPSGDELRGDEIGGDELRGDELAGDEPSRHELAGDELRGAIEALLLVVDEPVATPVLATAVGVPTPRVEEVLCGLRDEYAAARRGFELREIAGGWRLYTRADFAPFVERFMLEGQQARLTQAALETLAVVAYRQPVSRSRVSAVRGVNVDGVMRTLVMRGLVEESGTDDASGALLYRTTAYFLERLGLRDLSELPRLADFLPEGSSIDELEEQVLSRGRDD